MLESTDRYLTDIRRLLRLAWGSWSCRWDGHEVPVPVHRSDLRVATQAREQPRASTSLALSPRLAEATEPDFESYPVRAARAPRRAILCTTLSGAHTARRSHRSRLSSRPQVQRRVFTDTPPIERYQEKLVARDDLDDGG